MTARGPRLLGVLAAAWLARDASAEPPAADPYAACEERMTRAPADRASAGCFYATAIKDASYDEAARRLEVHRARDPDHPAILQALGNVYSDRDLPAAETLYREAIAGWRARRDAPGAVFTSINLSNYLVRRERIREAVEALERADDLASLDLTAALALRTQQARLLWREGVDLARAYRLLKDVEARAFAGEPTDLLRTVQTQCLHTLGSLTAGLGRFDEALGYFRRLLDVARAKGDKMVEATSLVRVAITMLAAIEDEPRDARADDTVAVARQALELGTASENRFAQALARRVLAALGPLDEVRGHLDECERLARELGQLDTQAGCAIVRADRLAATAPDEALAAASEAVRIAEERGDPRLIASARAARARLSWRRGVHDDAVRETLSAVDAIAAVRDRQRDDRVRSLLLADWGSFYYRASGWLLAEHAATGRAQDLETAFELIERLRARSLLEELDRAAASAPLGGSGPLRGQRDAALDRIERIQRRLVDPALDADARRATLAELGAAEVDEAAIREQLAAADPAFAALRPRTVTIAELRAALAPGEALLSFQLAAQEDVLGDPAGAAWLVVVTAEGATVHRIGGRATIEAAVEAYRGLVDRRDGADDAGATALYRMLGGAALDDLPGRITRLIVVPDGAIHRVPLGALRAAPGSPRLSERFEISLAPSATVWARLRERDSQPRAALVYADPELGATNANARLAASGERAWALETGEKLGRLPYAREEARRVAERVGPGSRVLVGPDASEASLKLTELGEFALLHFAAHAVVDDAYPERSAVLLAPGAETEDGLLQIRDIVTLGLDGKVVILSACDSATGTLVRGEGVHGLTRAFLRAGARAVVGSLWPLRDDEAAAIMTDLYRHLARGERLDRALARAQRDRARAGAPASAWAGLVVVGDGSVRPVAVRPVSGAAWLWFGAAELAVVLFALVLFKRRG